MQILIGQWLTSLKHYLLMCILLSSPERLPYNSSSVLLTGFLYYLVGLLLVDAAHGYELVCAQITLELFMLGLITYVGLNLRNSLPRFKQTFSALIGTNAIITALTIPAYRFAIDSSNVDDNMLIYVTLVFLTWNLAVLSLIFKRSFDISTQLSAMISFAYFIIFQLTVIWLFS